MRRIAGSVAWLIVIMGAMSLVAPRSNAQLPADLILTNGRVLTVDARDSIAEAVAIAAGRIVAVGSTADVIAFVNRETVDRHVG